MSPFTGSHNQSLLVFLNITFRSVFSLSPFPWWPSPAFSGCFKWKPRGKLFYIWSPCLCIMPPLSGMKNMNIQRKNPPLLGAELPIWTRTLLFSPFLPCLPFHQDGLQDQMLGIVVAAEEPATEEPLKLDHVRSIQKKP